MRSSDTINLLPQKARRFTDSYMFAARRLEPNALAIFFTQLVVDL